MLSASTDGKRVFPSLEEELAGPPHAIAPVNRFERISSIDTLRGFALLGILLLNIDSFGLPEFFHDLPVGLPKPAFLGLHAHLNLVLLLIKWMFFEGKMRFLFTLLFGAGVVLMTGRAEKRGAADQAADIYFRRNMWLVVLGVLHGTFIWGGDILLQYGMCALLLLYPCRKLKPKTLFIAGSLLSVVVATFGLLEATGGIQDVQLSRSAASAAAAQNAGKQLTPQQKQAQQDWQARVLDRKVTNKKIDARMKSALSGYLNRLQNEGIYYEQHDVSRSPFFWLGESGGIMLIGMGLFKIGFLSASLSYGTYIRTSIVGFLISIPIYVLGLSKAYASGFSFLTVETWVYGPYELAELAGGLAMTAVFLMIIKSGAFRRLLHPIAAVGQTALTNYLLTSVLCQFIFLWGPWKLYGQLEYYQIYYVVFAVWAVNLTLSTLWLRAFEFGPAEWAWRSATYWKLQPMRKKVQP